MKHFVNLFTKTKDSKICSMILFLSTFGLWTNCGVQNSDVPLSESTNYINMLTKEACEPNMNSFQHKSQFVGEQAQQIQSSAAYQYQGQENGESGSNEGGSDEGNSGEATEAEQTQTQQRTQCQLQYYQHQDFPQPGCDAEGCCEINAELREELQLQKRIRCRCRIRTGQGGQYPNESTGFEALPECCCCTGNCDVNDDESEDEKPTELETPENGGQDGNNNNNEDEPV